MNEVVLVESIDGELYFDIPTRIVEQYGWEDGDDVEFVINDNGSLTLRKVETKNDSE